MVIGRPNVRERSRSSEEAAKQDLDRVRWMTVRQRMLLALELGRRGRALQKRATQGRAERA